MFFHTIQIATCLNNRSVKVVIHKIESRETPYKTNYAFRVGNHSTCVKIIF